MGVDVPLVVELQILFAVEPLPPVGEVVLVGEEVDVVVGVVHDLLVSRVAFAPDVVVALRTMDTSFYLLVVVRVLGVHVVVVIEGASGCLLDPASEALVLQTRRRLLVDVVPKASDPGGRETAPETREPRPCNLELVELTRRRRGDLQSSRHSRLQPYLYKFMKA